MNKQTPAGIARVRFVLFLVLSTYFVRYSASYLLIQNTGKHGNNGGMGANGLTILCKIYFSEVIEEFLAEILVFNHFSVEFHRDL